MTKIRNDWTAAEVADLFNLPLVELLHQAQQVHRANFDPLKVQLATLLNIKTGACPEDCKYCSQSGFNKAALKKEKLMTLAEVRQRAEQAKANGATRFCMGAAWRSPNSADLDKVIEMIKMVNELGLESCVTLGMLSSEQAQRLKAADLDYYNHNLDTSPEYYKEIITTRTYQDRLDTLANVRAAGIKVCCGGIMGLGESREDRIHFLLQLANQEVQPESVPINQLIAVKGTPLQHAPRIDDMEFIRVVAIARIMMPKSYVRLSAGRDSMSEVLQLMCFFAGANSMHYGEKLLTEANALPEEDQQMLMRAGMQVEPLSAPLLIKAGHICHSDGQANAEGV